MWLHNNNVVLRASPTRQKILQYYYQEVFQPLADCQTANESLQANCYSGYLQHWHQLYSSVLHPAVINLVFRFKVASPQASLQVSWERKVLASYLKLGILHCSVSLPFFFFFSLNIYRYCRFMCMHFRSKFAHLIKNFADCPGIQSG